MARSPPHRATIVAVVAHCFLIAVVSAGKEEVKIFYSGEGAKQGYGDMKCTFGQSQDLCACQVRCGDRCARAIRLCKGSPQCTAISVNGPTLEQASWATLKQQRDVSVDAAALERRASARPIEPAAAPHVDARTSEGAAAKDEPRFAPNELSRWQQLCMHAQASGRANATRGKSLCSSIDDAKPIGDSSLAVLALTYHSPASLHASMTSWHDGGLLALAAERVLIANDPLPIERLLARAFGFELVEPRQFGKRAKLVKPNVATIGTAFGWAMRRLRATFVLFLEKDFRLVPTPVETLHRELSSSAALLARGASVVYLRSRTDQGCGSFPGCGQVTFFAHGNAWQRKSNWWTFYCADRQRPGLTPRRLQDCVHLPATPEAREARFRCYTSEDANWSLNAAMIHRRRALLKKFGTRNASRVTLSQMGTRSWSRQDEFEDAMINSDWGLWKVPLCLSYHGLFAHEEVDG